MNSDMPHAAQRRPTFNGERPARTGRPTRPPMDGHMGALKCWVLRLLGKRTPKSTLGGPPVLDVLSGTLLAYNAKNAVPVLLCPRDRPEQHPACETRAQILPWSPNADSVPSLPE